jgi:hypothetical protein
MALLTGTKMTLIDLAKRSKDGSILAIAEVMNKVNTIMDDAVWVRSNGETQHITAKRLSLPTGSWRKINAGVSLEKSTTQQIVEGIGMLEAYSQVDIALVDVAPDKASFRLSEDLAFVEGMSQTLAYTIVYGSTAGAPEKFDGFATRFAHLTTLGTSAVHNVHNYGGTGSVLNSIFVVQWGATTVHMIYPKNSASVGFAMSDDGVQTVYDASGYPYKVYQTHFKQNAGMCVRDDRCVQRVCNIPATAVHASNKLIEALRQMPSGGAGSVIYANTTVLTCLDKEAKDKTNVQYGPADVFGRPTMFFRGIPVKQVDSLLSTETALT